MELALGASISPDSVYEGGDVYFDCRIKAQPRPRKIEWQFNVSLIQRLSLVDANKKSKGTFFLLPESLFFP